MDEEVYPDEADEGVYMFTGESLHFILLCRDLLYSLMQSLDVV